MSNDRFTIPEPVLPIASKRRVAHYPKVTKKEKTNMANGCNHQPNKQGALTSLKGYISIVSIWGSFLKFLRVGNTCLRSPSLLVLVRLFPRGDLGLYLYLYVFYYVISTSFIVPAYSIPRGYVQNSDLHRVYACIFNSWKVYAQILYSSLLTSMGSVLAYSIPRGYVHKFFSVLTFMGSMLAYLIPKGYVRKFFGVLVWDLCLHIQFPEDICTSFLMY